MKTIVRLFFAFFILFGASSCTKSFTCSCTFADASKNFDITIEKSKKNDAKVTCQDYSVFVGNCGLK